MKDWLKIKNYIHFSPKLKPQKRDFIIKYVESTKKISTHRFFPLIHKTIVEKKYRRGYDEDGVRKQKRELKKKRREIFYANHLDAQVYAFYGRKINDRLECIYSKNPKLNNAVLAYRAIPFNKYRNKSNIDFAYEIFDEIRSLQGQSHTVICLDIKAFFDSLDHKILKKLWCELLEEKTLPKDHYNIFKSVTRFSYVEISDILKKIPRNRVKKLAYLNSKNINSFCNSEKEFRDRIVKTGIIKRNYIDKSGKEIKNYGIPQGTPISAVLSNLYMLNFDKYVIEMVSEIGGSYKRYSDDLIVICHPKYAQEIELKLIDLIDKELKLIIQKEKNQIVFFDRIGTSNDYTVSEEVNGVKTQGKVLSYLGFEFDGKNIRIRQKGISKYYRELKRLIRRKARYAYIAKRKKDKNPKLDIDTWIYRERIYKNKSHLGAKRKKVNGKVFWGNYYSYVKSSSQLMKEPAIKKQLRNHWKIVEGQILYFEKKYSLPRSKKKEKIGWLKKILLWIISKLRYGLKKIRNLLKE